MLKNTPLKVYWLKRQEEENKELASEADLDLSVSLCYKEGMYIILFLGWICDFSAVNKCGVEYLLNKLILIALLQDPYCKNADDHYMVAN